MISCLLHKIQFLCYELTNCKAPHPPKKIFFFYCLGQLTSSFSQIKEKFKQINKSHLEVNNNATGEKEGKHNAGTHLFQAFIQ